jgi:subtilase family serine protease
MLNRRRMSLLPLVVLSSLAFVACSSSGHGDNSASSEDDLSTWQSIGQGRPAWATAARKRMELGDSEQISVQVHLKLRNEAQMDAEIAAVSDPDSPTFGQYLTNEQFLAKYAPTSEDVAAVRTHLEKHGLSITHVPGNNLFVMATGPHAAVSSAFGTKLANYDVDGDLRHAPVGTARVPRAIAAKVSGTLGLSKSATFKPRGVSLGGIARAKVPQLLSKKPAAASTLLPNCAEWWGAAVDTTDPQFGNYPAAVPVVPCGYGPGQMRAAYGFTNAVRTGNDGTGVKVAIVDAYLSPTLLQDAQTYAAQHDPDYPLLDSQFSAQMAPGTPQTPDPGWYGEQSLDVEAVHAIAPGATIVYVGAQSPTDIDLVAAINLIADKNLASIISNSYGSPEQQGNDFVVWNAAVKHAALKGVGIYFSSGDSGDETTRLGAVSADFPASIPGVTAVGGTSLALGQRNERVFEAGWETTASFLTLPAPDGDAGADAGPGAPFWDPPAPGFFAFGAGGGTSLVYDQPDYQKGVVPDALANIPGAPARVVPDVAMDADPETGFIVGMTSNGTYAEGPTGGTSLACPLFAASMALAEQHAHKKLGFANPRLYKARAKAFRDIVPNATPQAVMIPSSQGNIIVTIDYAGQAIQTAVGYDNVTGIGAPDGDNFLKAIK